MKKYQKLKDMGAKKWLSENCPHLDKTSQKIGLYELCLVMEEYHKYKSIDSNVSGSFYSFIDRLRVVCEWKYPNRIWNNDVYYGIAFQWLGKEKELEQKVLKLEKEMNKAIH